MLSEPQPQRDAMYALSQTTVYRRADALIWRSSEYDTENERIRQTAERGSAADRLAQQPVQ